MSTQRPLTLAQYEMIFRIAYSVVAPATLKPLKQCFYINSMAAEILIHHHKLDPLMTSGYFAIVLDDSLLQIGGIDENGFLFSNEHNYHAWLQLDDWAVDFTAPLYGDLLSSRGVTPSFGPKMFQKELAAQINPNNGLVNSGDYYFLQNPTLTQKLINYYIDPLYKLMIEICINWYNPNHTLITPIYNFKKLNEQILPMKLLNLNIVDAW